MRDSRWIVAAVLFGVILMIVGCSDRAKPEYKEITIGQDVADVTLSGGKQLLSIRISGCYYYREPNGHVVLVTTRDGKTITAAVVYSVDRDLVYSKGVGVVDESSNLDDYIGQPFGVLKREFGPPPLDLGSGFYIPAYFTNRGNLVTFGSHASLSEDSNSARTNLAHLNATIITGYIRRINSQYVSCTALKNIGQQLLTNLPYFK
ncbi:MAG: hypothetical protein FWG78_01370 [Coriobacteriia bacterium]|nr:hypothetical protein [Coriobacteriia bacterium]